MGNNSPLVSVVIPTHNRCALLFKAINSVLEQEYDNLELIVVDDCSEDKTFEVMSNYKNPRVRYIRLDRKGGGASARNAGIKSSNGDYIAFLDDDDEWHPRKLSKQLDVFKDNPRLGMVYTGYYYVSNKTNEIIKTRYPSKKGNIYNDLLRSNYVGTTSTAVINRECFTKVGMFDECLRSCQDWDMWIRISKHYELGYVAEPLVNFLIHNNRITTNLESRIQGRERLFAKVFDEIKDTPSILSYHYFRIGYIYCRGGKVSRGRSEIFSAIKTYPLNLTYYKYFIPSLFGPYLYKKIINGNRRIKAYLGHHYL